MGEAQLFLGFLNLSICKFEQMFLILFHFCPFLQMSYQFVLRLCQEVRLAVLINLVLMKQNKSVRFPTFIFRFHLSGFSFRSFTSPDLVNTERSNFFVHNISVPRPACFFCVLASKPIIDFIVFGGGQIFLFAHKNVHLSLF